MRRILPSITTHGTTKSSWREKIGEIQELGLREVGLFLTGLSEKGRAACYSELERVKRRFPFTIPFVHAVSSMPEEELHYLMLAFKTERFNLHPTWEYPLTHRLSDAVKAKIFIENSSLDRPLRPEDIEGFGGILFDLSHLEDARRRSPATYRALLALTERYSVGANHISAVPLWTPGKDPSHSKHESGNPTEMRYLADLDRRAFSPLCAIELENSLAEQVQLVPVIRSSLLDAERSGGRVETPDVAEPSPLS